MPSMLPLMSWAPDGKLLAVQAQFIVPGGDGPMPIEQTIVFNLASVRAAAFRAVEGEASSGSILWKQDGRGFAQLVATGHREGHKTERQVRIFDVASGSVRDAGPPSEEYFKIEAWTSSGKSVLCSARAANAMYEQRQKYELREVYTDGKPNKVIIGNYDIREWYSPDRAFRIPLANLSGSISVQDTTADKTVVITKDADAGYAHWCPNSRMLLYYAKSGRAR